MPKLINLPKIGVNMTDAVIARWLVKEGDAVASGSPILLAETDKATQEIPATESGTVARLLVKEGDAVEVLKPLLVLLDDGETASDAAIEALLGGEVTPASIPAPVAAAPALAPAAEAQTGARVKITPLARKTAEGLGVDFRLIPPSPANGRISRADVIAYAESRKAPAAPVSAPPPSPAAPPAWQPPQPVMPTQPVQLMPGDQKLSRVRTLIAGRMTESVNTKPSVPLTLTVDAAAMVRWQKETKAAGNPVKYNAMIIAAAARALREFPAVNAVLEGDILRWQERVNVGLAVDAEQGLVVPKVFDADTKTPSQIQLELDRLAANVRAGRADPDALTGGTFTVSNLGMYEIEQFAAIINPPETCILAVGMVKDAPVVKNGALTAGSVMTLTLSFDHRVIDGGPAARFLQRIKHLLECPALLLG